MENAGKNKLVEMISTTTIGTKEEPYPMIANIWDFFSEKGTKTVFFSVGSGNTCVPDLDFAETIGCPLVKLDTPEFYKKWDEIRDLLKSRKISETTTDFAKPAARKWVLPKNLIVEDCIPSMYDGSIEINGVTIKTRKWVDLVKEHCARIGLSEGELRLDAVKIDSSPFTSLILDSLWQSGFRPSVLLINWIESPDTNTSSLLCAGHLQMLGYALVGKEGNRFLYYYTDTNYYETCSWEQPAKRFENPFVSNLAKAIYPGSTGGSIHFPLAK